LEGDDYLMKVNLLAAVSLLASLVSSHALADECVALGSLAAANQGCQIPAAGLPLKDKDRDLGGVLPLENGKPIIKADLKSTLYLRIDRGGTWRLEVADGKLKAIESVVECAPAVSSNATSGYCWLQAGTTLPDGKRGQETISPVTVAVWETGNKALVNVLKTSLEFIAESKGKTPGEEIVVLKLGPAQPAAAPVKPAQVASCPDEAFDLPEGDVLWGKCKENGYLCVTPSGQIVSQPELREGHSVTVVLLQPEFIGHELELEVEFKRSLLVDKNVLGLGLHASQWSMGPRRTIDLPSAGTLHVTTRMIVKDTEALYRQHTGLDCTRPTDLEKKNTFDVRGHYHFMLGIMPTFAGLFDRKHTLNRSDDGVQRVYQQDIHDVDWAFTLSGYPWGASLDDFGALGIIVGTSVRDIGERWYGGLEWDSPIGLGIAGGAAVIVVPKLDDDFVSGQPLTDTQVPVHSSAVVTWFVGINIEAHLFALAFKGLAGDDN
jgi:hypothetical protein